MVSLWHFIHLSRSAWCSLVPFSRCLPSPTAHLTLLHFLSPIVLSGHFLPLLSLGVFDPNTQDAEAGRSLSPRPVQDSQGYTVRLSLQKQKQTFPYLPFSSSSPRISLSCPLVILSTSMTLHAHTHKWSPDLFSCKCLYFSWQLNKTPVCINKISSVSFSHSCRRPSRLVPFLATVSSIAVNTGMRVFGLLT